MPWLKISNVWYGMFQNSSPSKVPTVKGLRYAYTDVYARKVTIAAYTEVMICFLELDFGVANTEFVNITGQ